MARERMSINLVRQKSNYRPQTVNLVNLRDIQSDYGIAARDPIAYLAGGNAGGNPLGVPAAVLKTMQDTYRVLKTQDPAVAKAAIEAIAQRPMPTNYGELLSRDSRQDEESLKTLFGGDMEQANQAAMDVVELRAARDDPSTFTLSKEASREPERVKAAALGFRDISYIEKFPMLLACAGFRRLPDKAASNGNNGFVPFQPGTQNRQVYVEPYDTEAIIFELDAEHLLKVLHAWNVQFVQDPHVNLSVQLGALAAKHRLLIMDDPGAQVDMLDPGRLVWTIMHSLAHSAIKSVSEPSGFSVNSFSEYLLPGALAFAVFVNRTQESGLGGLMTVYKDGLLTFLDLFRGKDRDCLHDPICWSADAAACHACLIVSETTCRGWNGDLDRHLLFGHKNKRGFLQ